MFTVDFEDFEMTVMLKDNMSSVIRKDSILVKMFLDV